MTESESKLRLLVLDSSYCFEAINKLGLERSVICRDLSGFFDHVYSVHPFASLVSSKAVSRFGFAEWHIINTAHTYIDGKVGVFNWPKFFSPLNFIFSQLVLTIQLIYLVKKKHISAIRAGDPLYLGVLGWVISRVCNIPLVVRVGGNHDKVYEVTKRPIMPRLFISRGIEKRLERFVLARAELVSGANNDNLQFALDNGAKPEKSTLFRYGNLIDSAHFLNPSARRMRGINLIKEEGAEPSKFILYLGRFEKVKHPDHVVRVLAYLLAHGHDMKVLLCGDGSMRESLRALSLELGIESKVLFCGNRNQDWLSKVIPNAALVVSPHTGRALTEAALGAAPIVAYDIDWQKELIEKGVTGELVPFMDLNALCAAALRLLNNPLLAQSLGLAARRRSLEMMSPDLLDEHERKEYLKLIAYH